MSATSTVRPVLGTLVVSALVTIWDASHSRAITRPMVTQRLANLTHEDARDLADTLRQHCPDTEAMLFVWQARPVSL